MHDHYPQTVAPTMRPGERAPADYHHEINTPADQVARIFRDRGVVRDDDSSKVNVAAAAELLDVAPRTMGRYLSGKRAFPERLLWLMDAIGWEIIDRRKTGEIDGPITVDHAREIREAYLSKVDRPVTSQDIKEYRRYFRARF